MAKAKKDKATPAPAPADPELSYIHALDILADAIGGDALAAVVNLERSGTHNNQWMLRDNRGALLACVGYEHGDLGILLL